MTNLERIKTTLCNIINSMSEEELFEFLSDYDEIYEYGKKLPFSEELLFTCSKCHQMYGDCEIKTHDSDEYICLHRFGMYCRAECE